MSDKLYPEQDPEELGEFYMRHLSAMTSEKLHEKSDIAAQLAWRDRVLARITAERDGLAKVVEKLPKTADGVAVIPGTFLYHPSGKYTIAIGSIGSRAPVELFNGGYTTISECFSTEAAARAASDRPAGSGAK